MILVMMIINNNVNDTINDNSNKYISRRRRACGTSGTSRTGSGRPAPACARLDAEYD